MRFFPLILATAALPIAFASCDRTVSETKHTETDSNGNVVKQETKTVRQDAAGNVTVDKDKVEDHTINR